MSLARRAFFLMRRPIDLVFAVLSIPAGFVLWCFRRVGASRLPLTRGVLRAIGVFPIRRHYYEPLFDTHRLDHSADRSLPGLDLAEPEQLALLAELRYADEIRAMSWEKPGGAGSAFHFGNGSYESGDADFLYAFLRHVKPRRVIEIGSGYSTRIVRPALERNGNGERHVCIEPYEARWLEALGVDVVRKRVEDCPLDMFRQLERGDLLFVDSSHMIRPRGDVLHEYLTILPTLQSGVMVHAHDIFTPRDYPAEWLSDDVKFWNEQYLLEAVLSSTERYRVVAALNHLKHHHFDALRAVCPYLTADREPGAFYFAVR